MARKKRQYLQSEQAKEPVSAMLPSVWETAIYARLSVENSKKNDDGDSIEGQIEICRDYVSEHPYLHLADTYVDNGWTGTNTDRPEFQRLLSDIREGKIKALVIKDFSRFSRDYIEAGNLLENIFPAMGVRFISVVDRYDSFETDGSASSLLIPLKNLINSFYSRDQSKKVSLAVHAKQLAGEHIPSMIPYGYRKSTTQEYRFEPDPETAPIVKRIYAQFLCGTGARPIMRQLNEEGIPSPGKLRYLRGQTNRACYWASSFASYVMTKLLSFFAVRKGASSVLSGSLFSCLTSCKRARTEAFYARTRFYLNFGAVRIASGRYGSECPQPLAASAFLPLNKVA